MSDFLSFLTVISPVVVALVGIIPAIIANRKKTEQDFLELKQAFENHKIESTNGCKKIQATLDSHIREDEDDKARNRRYRILRFYDELCEGREHSESHYEDIIDDIDDYESYCATHKDFKNNRAKVAMQHIKDNYAALKASGNFLKNK